MKFIVQTFEVNNWVEIKRYKLVGEAINHARMLSKTIDPNYGGLTRVIIQELVVIERFGQRDYE